MIAGPHRASDWVYVAGILIAAAFVIGEVYRRNRAGLVLLDLTSQGRKEIHFGIGLFMLVAGCIESLFLPTGRYQGFFLIGYGVAMLLFATRRAQIRRAGISGRKLFRWEEIEEYYLGLEGGLALKLKDKGWIRPGLRVPSDRCQQANQILATQLPAQKVSKTIFLAAQ